MGYVEKALEASVATEVALGKIDGEKRMGETDGKNLGKPLEKMRKKKHHGEEYGKLCWEYALIHWLFNAVHESTLFFKN